MLKASAALKDMSLAEIACRGRHEASKWLERVAWNRSTADPQAQLRGRAAGLGDPTTALRVLRDDVPHRFFPGVDDRAALDAIRRRMPADCRALITAATDILVNRRFDLLGFRALSFGDPIDWRLDPIHARRSPPVHWSEIDPLDPGQVGDSKIVWELNRHQWIVGLAQAWALEGDERFAEACLGAIDAWLDANPTGVGINWASSLEVALRLMSWCWTLVLLRESSALCGARVIRILAAVWQHATHVRRYLSYYFSPNTHLTAEALGLFYAGTLFQEFRDASSWRDLGARILIAQNARQISDDGVHFEQSTCYHRYTIEIYLHFLLLAERNGISVPDHVVKRVERMVEFLIAVRRPDGSIPAIGDGDDGTLLPLAHRRSDDSRGVFAVAAAMFRRPEFVWAAGVAASEVPWLLGTDGLRRFDAIRPEPPVGPPSRVFPAAGYAVLRNGWDRTAHQMIVDTGPLGCPISGGHGHADLLSVQCAVYGEPCLVDAGTYCYTPDPEWRDFFRSSAAHSTIQIDGLSQSRPAGPFRWTHRPSVQLREWQSTPDFDLVDADCDAFVGLPDPVVHRRRVVFVKPRFWIIVDDVMGASTHHVELTFQFAPIPVALGPEQWARGQMPSGATVWLSSFASVPMQPAIRAGERMPIRGWISPRYGQRVAAPTLTYSGDAALPWRALTVLIPDRAGTPMPPVVHVIRDGRGRPFLLVFEATGEAVSVGEQTILVQGASPL